MDINEINLSQLDRSQLELLSSRILNELWQLAESDEEIPEESDPVVIICPVCGKPDQECEYFQSLEDS